ncbi:MAG TPA: YARHG domain-containing protein [Atopobiaceae bacterium]|nr:YARHG domain-containing protein [Atopobiaceae bacterium]
MICSSCGRTVEDGVAFCPHCGSAVIQPFMSDEDKARADAEAEAALKSLDEIKHTAARPAARTEEQDAAPVGVSPVKRNYSTSRKDARSSTFVIAMLGALALAALLLVILPRIIKPAPSPTPTIAERDPNEESPPIGAIPPIQELSAQDNPRTEEAVIAYGDDTEEDGKDSENESGFVLPDSDTHLYTAEELEDLTEWDLEIARNEIYARHGRGFNDSTLQAYFDGQDWYERRYTPEEFDAQSGLLNDVEQANVATISAAERAL